MKKSKENRNNNLDKKTTVVEKTINLPIIPSEIPEQKPPKKTDD